MVSNLQLLYTHLRLVEILGCSDSIPFADITVIAYGDLFRAVYVEYHDVWKNSRAG